jgi:hypothetical protein
MAIAKERGMNLRQILTHNILSVSPLFDGDLVSTDKSTAIDIIGMNRNTPIPRQLDKFWTSQENKRNLQHLVRDIVCSRAYGKATIVASSVVSDDKVLAAVASGGEEIPELLNWIEEADARLVVHVEWAVRVKQCGRVVILSNDTDTFALLLRYISHIQTLGLQEMWQQYGTEEKRRMLPLHHAVSQRGAPLAKNSDQGTYIDWRRLHE